MSIFFILCFLLGIWWGQEGVEKIEYLLMGVVGGLTVMFGQ